MSKCSFKDRIVTACDALTESVQELNPSSKARGLHKLIYSNQDTHKVTREYYIVKSGDHTAKGIILNYCPFCGEKLHNE